MIHNIYCQTRIVFKVKFEEEIFHFQKTYSEISESELKTAFFKVIKNKNCSEFSISRLKHKQVYISTKIYNLYNYINMSTLYRDFKFLANNTVHACINLFFFFFFRMHFLQT